MAKVLLKHVCKPNNSYQRDVAKIARVTISVKSVNAPKIEMYSSKELVSKGFNIEKVESFNWKKAIK